MKTVNFIRSIIPLSMLLAIIMIASVSCKKNNASEPNVPPEPVPVPSTPCVFAERPLPFMSATEIAGNKEFPGHLLNQLGKGLVRVKEEPGPLNPFKEMGESLFEVYDYFHTEAEFDKINNSLSQIQQQITVLQNSVNQLINNFQITTDELKSLTINIDLATYITDIQNAMDSTTVGGLQYFPRRAAQFKAGQISLTDFKTDTSNLRIYAYNIEHNIGTNVTDWAGQLHKDLCVISTPAMIPLADLIFSHMTPAQMQDSIAVFNAYNLLESYFLQVVNSQFQCATMQTNADYFYYPSDTIAPTAWVKDDLTSWVKDEISSFLWTVDYLMMNIDDYRSQHRFEFDMQYANAGLAPDNISILSLARAQFVANLLYGSLGLSYPVVSGHITLPKTYATIGNAAISVNIGGNLRDTTPTVIAGIIPYTYWVDGSPAVCHPDNQWNVYRFGTLGKSDVIWPATSQTIQVVAPNNQSPWVHLVNIQGTITPKYYNPRNPNQTSLTKTSECTVEFAYFAASWKWGFLQLTNTPLTDNWIKSNKPLKDQFFDFSSFNTSLVENSANVPFAATTNTWQCTYQNTISWDYYSTMAGSMFDLGTMPTTSHYYVMVNGNYLNVTTGSEMPPTGGTLNAWAWYSANYTMNGSGGADLTISIGTVRNFTDNMEGGTAFATIGDDVVRQNWHDQAGTTWNSGFGTSANLKANTSYQPGIQYYYQTYNVTKSSDARISLNSGFQFVYGGYYPQPMN